MSGRKRHNYDYEYGYHTDSEYKQRRHHNPRLRAVDTVLFFLVIILPLIGLAMWLAEIPVPIFWLGIYTAAVQTLAGLLFLFLTSRGVGGFGKVGYFFSHTRGKRWMTTKEAKTNTYLFGGFMLAIGILVLLLTLKSHDVI